MVLPDLLRWCVAAISLIGLGLSMGFSPTLYGVSIHLLTREPQPTIAIRWMVGGLVAGSTVLLLLFQFVDPEYLEDLLRHSVDHLLLKRGIDLVAGVLLIIVAAVLALRIREDRIGPRDRTVKEGVAGGTKPGRHRRIFLIGLPNTVIGVSGFATMYLTARVVSAASEHLLIRLAFYALFVAALAAPYLVVAQLWMRFPRFADRVTSGYQRIARRDFRIPAAVAMSVIGLAFIGHAGWQLISSG